MARLQQMMAREAANARALQAAPRVNTPLFEGHALPALTHLRPQVPPLGTLLPQALKCAPARPAESPLAPCPCVIGSRSGYVLPALA
eukprot:9087849-Pyramimonas_sp.AAC.1